MSRSAFLLLLCFALPAACTNQTAPDDDDGGCQSDSDCKGDRLCVENECVNPDEVQCAPVGSTCDATGCCGDALCAQYSGDSVSTVCEALCTIDAECDDGCCLPLGDSGQSTCAPASYCGGEGGSNVPGPGSGGSGGAGGDGGGPSNTGGSPGMGGSGSGNGMGGSGPA
jgi:hypothetical protein